MDPAKYFFPPADLGYVRGENAAAQRTGVQDGELPTEQRPRISERVFVTNPFPPVGHISPAQRGFEHRNRLYDRAPEDYQSGSVLHGGGAEELGRTVRQSPTGRRVKLNGKEYIVVSVLEFADDVNGMNGGIRVLKDTQGVLVVEKKLKMNGSQERARAEAEKKALYQIVKAGGCANINKIYESFWEPGSSTSSLILEYCNRGSLDRFIDAYKEKKVYIVEKHCWKTLYDLASALCMCHFGIKDPVRPADKVKDWNTICHLDIKITNVFMDYRGAEWPRVVLGDFGCSVTRDDIMARKVDHRKQPYGTPRWFPPENDVNNEGEPKEHGRKIKGAFGKYTDIWQMGGIIQAMCRLEVNPDMFWVDRGYAAGKVYSADLNEVVNKSMVRGIDLRPTALDVATAVKGLIDARGYKW